MSKFKTSVPITLGAVIAKLPKRSYVEAVTISEDRKSAEVIWGCDDLKTGFTFPVEYPVERLNANSQSAIADSQGQESTETAAVNVKDSVDSKRKGGRKVVT